MTKKAKNKNKIRKLEERKQIGAVYIPHVVFSWPTNHSALHPPQ